jgi:hypothetical protein
MITKEEYKTNLPSAKLHSTIKQWDTRTRKTPREPQGKTPQKPKMAKEKTKKTTTSTKIHQRNSPPEPLGHEQNHPITNQPSSQETTKNNPQYDNKLDINTHYQKQITSTMEVKTSPQQKEKGSNTRNRKISQTTIGKNKIGKGYKQKHACPDQQIQINLKTTTYQQRTNTEKTTPKKKHDNPPNTNTKRGDNEEKKPATTTKTKKTTPRTRMQSSHNQKENKI